MNSSLTVLAHQKDVLQSLSSSLILLSICGSVPIRTLLDLEKVNHTLQERVLFSASVNNPDQMKGLEVDMSKLTNERLLLEEQTLYIQNSNSLLQQEVDCLKTLVSEKDNALTGWRFKKGRLTLTSG